MSYDEKLKILVWISGLQLSVDDLKSCPDHYLVDAVICTFLAEKQEITASEAKCLMQSIVNAKQNEEVSDDYPEKVDLRAFRIGMLYQKMFFMFHSCAAAVGLKIFQTIIKFDGADFQRSYAKTRFTSQPIDANILFAQLVNILSVGSSKLKLTCGSAFEEFTEDFKNFSFADQGKIEKLRVDIFKLHEDAKFAECLKKLNIALEINDSCVEFLWLKAECLIMIDDLKEAEKFIAKAAKFNPTDPNVIFVQGLKNYYEGKFKESIEKFDEALEVFPGFKKAIDQRAKAKKLLGLIHKGIYHFFIDYSV